MTNQIAYTLATTTDLQTLIDYRLEFLIEYWGKQPKEAVDELRAYLHSYFSRFIKDGSYACFLARENGKVVGIGGMIIREQPGNFKNPNGRVGYLMNMYSIPSHRRKGICSTILNKLVEEGKARGVTAFELHATKEGETVYPQHGFKIHNEPTYRRYL